MFVKVLFVVAIFGTLVQAQEDFDYVALVQKWASPTDTEGLLTGTKVEFSGKRLMVGVFLV
jgi:hypothetical protein